MTEITRDDLRAAVSSGLMTEGQAASLMVLSEERSGVRSRRSGLDEPFELFRGFNEIFIVVGLVILYGGWSGVTGLNVLLGDTESFSAIIFALIGAGLIILLARYFTLMRRMVAPSIALSLFFGLSMAQVGINVAGILSDSQSAQIAITGLVTALGLTFYYWLFRVPFTVALVALSVFVMGFGLTTLGGALPESPTDLFLLSADGPFAFRTIGLGLVGLGIALSFDMSDPHRVTRRASSGFWLHVIAAPAIVNTIALTLFTSQMTGAQVLVLAFVLLMAAFAIIIDRRSFLVAGVGYIVALSFTVIENQAFLAIMLLGLVLVLLGAQWERLRRAIMTALPDFPGKNRLPPYGAPLSKDLTP